VSRILGLIRTERASLAVAVVYSVATGLLSLALPVAVQALVNTVAFGSVLQPVAVLTLLVTAALGAAALLYVLRAIVLERMQRRIFARQASDVLDSLLRYKVSALDGQHVPELVNRFLDVTTVQKAASVLLVDGLTLATQTLAGVVLLAAYHPYLLVFDVVLVVAIIVVLVVLGRGAVRTSIEESRSKYEVLAWFEEVARHSVSLRSRSGARVAVDRANTLVLDYLRNRGRHFQVLLRQLIGAQLLQVAALSSLLGIGGYLVIAGELTLGQLVAAELVVSLAAGGVAKFGKSLETYYDLQAALDKLSHLTGMPLEQDQPGVAALVRDSGVPAGLRLHEVTFGYSRQAPVVENASLSVEPGAKVAIHGRNAAGKSTLLDLLMGLREPHHGRIELDGIDYRSLRKEDLRSDILLVRGTEILPDSVASNIALGLDASPEQLRDALTRAGVLEAVQALPDGWNTVLSPSGRPLAPSHALRLCFARAILQRPKLLLVDEALDAIDDLRIDGHLVQTLFHTRAPWTLIAATERPELWQFFDTVYALEDGELHDDAASLTEDK
jgi:ABC-type bacteriocin/lantibiotic exporter with double-glycine peptidase domain